MPHASRWPHPTALSVPRTNVRSVVMTRSDDAPPTAVGQQLSLADPMLSADWSSSVGEQALSDITMVVVDLETTGGSPEYDAITEIGAVKIRGGEILGEFATLLNPGRTAIPPQIVALTGITEAMVYDAPPLDAALPAFLEFARGCVLVAHNARFDVGFLRRNAQRRDLEWSFPTALCTLTLARRILSRDETRSFRLGDLSEHFAVSVTPTHRALDDARATVEVLHALLERVGNRGVATLDELRAYRCTADRAVHDKRHLAQRLPSCPGVYLFRGPGEEVLYIGTAVDLRRRVRSYFSGTDPRRRMGEMVRLATRVDHVACAHDLEAGVRELRLLAAHRPAYNRRSTQPHRGWWVRLSTERFSRLTVTRTAADEAIGPIRSRADATEIADLLAELAGLRTCRGSLGSASHHWCHTPAEGGAPVGGCAAAASRPQTLPDYLPRVEAVRRLFDGACDDLLTAGMTRLAELSAAHMFESAARYRDRLAKTIESLDRCQRLHALTRIEQLVLARPDGHGGWRLAVIRHGRLASAGHAPTGLAPVPVIDALTAAAETVLIGCGPLHGAAPEEAALIYRWTTEVDSRIVSATQGLALASHGAGRWRSWSAAARTAAEIRVKR